MNTATTAMTSRRQRLSDLLTMARDHVISPTDETLLHREIKHIALHVFKKKFAATWDYDDLLQETYYNLYRRLPLFNPDKCRNPANWVVLAIWNSTNRYRIHGSRWIPTANEEIEVKIEQCQEQRHLSVVSW
jgi:hypothetical protein